MKTAQLFRSDRPRTGSGKAGSWLAAALLASAAGLGAPWALAQQSQEPPATQEPPTTQQTPPSSQGEAQPGLEMTERKFQDWTLRCGRSQQGPEVCEVQQQTIDNEGRTVMAVAVGTLPGTSDLGLLIILPLRILLPSGVALAIDGGSEIPLQVDWCEQHGCRIEMLIGSDLLNRLKAGHEAKVFFEALDPEGQRRSLGYPISLLGLTAALNELIG
jgi:invasion protein IalB